MRLAHALAVLAVAFSLSAVAQVPIKIGYQGFLTTSGGVPVNTTVSMTVKLYNHPTAGAMVWSETQSVAVANGVYSVVLGNTTPLTESVLDGQRYLTVAVGGDPDMTPRTPLTSAPYAIRFEGNWNGVTASSGDLLLAGGRAIYISGLQVLGERQPGLADFQPIPGVDVADSGPVNVATTMEVNFLAARLNALLGRLRAHGLIDVTNGPAGMGATVSLGAGTATVSFIMASDWPGDGKVRITFPPQFNVNFATVSAENVSGTLTTSASGQTVTLTRVSGTITSGGTTITISLSDVPYSGAPGTTGPITITTQTNVGATIETGGVTSVATP